MGVLSTLSSGFSFLETISSKLRRREPFENQMLSIRPQINDLDFGILSKNGWLAAMVVFIEWNEERMASPLNSKFKASVICACT